MVRGGALTLVFRAPQTERERRRLAAGGDRVVDVAFALTGRERPDVGGLHEHCDHRGSVGMGSLASPLPGLVHSVIDRAHYDDVLLPGWEEVEESEVSVDAGAPCFSHLDHLTLACEPDTMDTCRIWYQETLGFVPIGEMRRDDLIVETQRGGLRLQALQLSDPDSPPFKLTFVEPLPGRNAGQVDVFLAHHGGPGVQHLALATSDIVDAVTRCRERGVAFVPPPPGYYATTTAWDALDVDLDERRELERAGVLVDAEKETSGLLQIFSEPELDRPTFFMEIISRRGAAGFGAGNVRALFRAIESSRPPPAPPQGGHDCTNLATDPGRTPLEARLSELAGGPLRYRRPPELSDGPGRRHPVVIVGAGPIGLTMALGLSRAGVPSVVVDDDDELPRGSRAVAWIKPTLEMWDRLANGLGATVRERGLAWAASKMLFGEEEIFAGDMQPFKGQKYDDFAVNLQQYYVEALLLAEARRSDAIELRWRNEVTAAHSSRDGMALEVTTPDGSYELLARYVVDASGARSPLRPSRSGDGGFRRQAERFLIVDVEVDPSATLPLERRFWFEPPFCDSRTALMLPQPDRQLRLDFSLGTAGVDADALEPDAARSRVRAMFDWLGFDVDFDVVWSSVYGFSVGAVPRASEGRLFFVGDALKSVSPFGARGGNGGIADVNNLAWKLAWVLGGRAPEALLDSYAEEQDAIVADHLRHIRNTADFMVPDSARAALRDAALELTRIDPRGRSYLNSGRFCHPPHAIVGRGLMTDRETGWVESGGLAPGSYFVDGALSRREDGTRTFLADLLGGPTREAFTLVVFSAPGDDRLVIDDLDLKREDVACVVVDASSRGNAIEVDDPDGVLRRRYGAHGGGVYLLRPDGFVAGRWSRWNPAGLREAWRRAIGLEPGAESLLETMPPREGSAVSGHDRIFRALHDGLHGLDAVERERALARAVLALAQRDDDVDDVLSCLSASLVPSRRSRSTTSTEI